MKQDKNALFIKLLYVLFTTAFTVPRPAGTVCIIFYVLLLISSIKYVKIL